MASDRNLSQAAEKALNAAAAERLSLITAESCTAGRLAVLLSQVPGAADHLHGGFVTYTKANKAMALGVSPEVMQSKSAVCCDVAIAMAEGALARSPAHLAVAITGVAGPEPDEDGNPVGRVCIAVARKDGGSTRACEKFYGDQGREHVQEQAMADAMNLLIEVIEKLESCSRSEMPSAKA